MNNEVFDNKMFTKTKQSVLKYLILQKQWPEISIK